MRIVATMALAVIASVAQAFAQSAELPRGLVAVSATQVSTDASARMRLGRDAGSTIYAGEISLRIAPRLAIGAEAIDLGTATGATSGRSFRSSGEQRERALVGVLRARAGGSERVAVDLVGGAGVLFQRHIATTTSCFLECVETFATELTARAPVFVAGVDVPIRIGRHVSLAPIGRYYFLRRERTTSIPNEPVPWQFEYAPSSRIGVGLSARVSW